MTAAAPVRAARFEDLEDLLALFRCLNEDETLLPAADAARIWSEIAATPGLSVLLAEHRGRPVAMCTLMVVPNLGRGGRPYAVIESVATLPHARRRGFGRAVIEAALARAWSRNCYKVMLTAGARGPGVLDFYAALGFSQDGKTALQMRRI